MPLSLVTAPAETPVTLEEACAHLRLSVGDDDATVNALIAAATAHLDGKDGILGRALVSQTWAMTMDTLPRDGFRLPLVPASVESIVYVATGGTETVLPAEQYALSGDRVVPAYGASWPAPRAQTDAVTVTFAAGYGGPSNVPAAIRQAMLLLVGYWYDQRSAVNVGNIVNEMPLGVDALLAPYRVISFG